jgi:hypothetical protein
VGPLAVDLLSGPWELEEIPGRTVREAVQVTANTGPALRHDTRVLG